MSKWYILALFCAAMIVGWVAGIKRGEDERRAIVDNLPETRAGLAAINAAMGEPDRRDLVCEEIFYLVGETLRMGMADER